MKPITSEVYIDAPPDRVFALMSDFANAPSRIPAITKVEVLTPGPVGVGTKFKETRRMMGKDATETMEVTNFDPPRSYNLGANSCGCLYDTRFNFTPDGSGTRVSFWFQATAQSFFAKLMSPLAGLMSGMLRKCVEADMAAIKAVAEKKT